MNFMTSLIFVNQKHRQLQWRRGWLIFELYIQVILVNSFNATRQQEVISFLVKGKDYNLLHYILLEQTTLFCSANKKKLEVPVQLLVTI